MKVWIQKLYEIQTTATRGDAKGAIILHESNGIIRHILGEQGLRISSLVIAFGTLKDGDSGREMFRVRPEGIPVERLHEVKLAIHVTRGEQILLTSNKPGSFYLLIDIEDAPKEFGHDKD